MLPSTRGKAGGVALLSQSPVRAAIHTLPKDIELTTRIAHHILSVPGLQIQVVTIYGQTATHTDAKEFNNLLLQNAIEATSLLPLPCIIAGDFNCESTQLPSYDALRCRGFADLRSLRERYYGAAMPPTCKEATWPDQALLSPELVSRYRGSQVLNEWHFDAHKVVCFDLATQSMLKELHWGLPKSWTELPIEVECFEPAYEAVRRDWGQPQTLEEWGQTIEHSVDLAYRWSQMNQSKVPFSATKGLPRAYRGRCCQRVPKQRRPPCILRRARAGDFNPSVEVVLPRHVKQVRQVRRLQALVRRLKKYGDEVPLAQLVSLQREWDAILRCDAFGPCFIHWCCQMPELGPPSPQPPSLDYAFTMQQLLQHEVQISLAAVQKQQQMHKQYMQYTDAKLRGSSKAFAVMRDSFSAPLSQIQVSVDDMGMIIPEDDVVRIYCEHASQFRNDAVVQVQGHPAVLQEHDDFSIVVKFHSRPIALPQEVSVSQTQVAITAPEITSKLRSYWQKLWWLPDGDPPGSDDFDNLLQTLPNVCHDLQVDLDDLQRWHTAIRQMKGHSCRGVDAISAAELKQLSPTAIQDLQCLLKNQPDGFDSWCMQGRVFPLPKTDNPGPGQIRPITVLAQLYRLQSRVTCSQILAHLADRLPVNLTGLLSGRGPVDATYFIQWRLELAHFEARACSGLCLDLWRCFNTIHRSQAVRILKQLGLSDELLRPWVANLAKLSRSWELQGQCSLPDLSNNGFPEGDCWSVVVMVAISFCWTQIVQTHLPDSLPLAYADNWEWICTDPAAHDEILRLTQLVVAALGMTVDWQKSWLYATRTEHGILLKAAIAHRVGPDVVCKVLSAMDLGCQMIYHGPPKLGKVTVRLAKNKRKLERLATMSHSLTIKAKLVQQGVYPSVAYGSELVPLSTVHVNNLRSQVAMGLLGKSASRNSAIADSCFPKVMEPFLMLLLRAIRLTRRFLLRYPAEQRKFLQVASRHGGDFKDVRGPAGALKYYLLQLGWTLNSAGDVHVAPFFSLNLWRDSAQEFTRIAKFVWMEQLLGNFSDRWAHRGMQAISQVDTLACLRPFDDPHRAQLIQEISGAFQTRVQQAAWDSDVDGTCKFCPDQDDKFHRWFGCPATAEARDSFQSEVDYAVENLPCFAELPCVLQDPFQMFYMTLHSQMPEPVLPHGVLGQLGELLGRGFPPTFYTDGSCVNPASIFSRHAAFAIVFDSALTNGERRFQAQKYIDTGSLPTTLHTLTMARLPGTQTIQRAELYAIVVLCEHFQECCIYTDSMLAVIAFQRCRDARSFASLQSFDNGDLLWRLFQAVRGGRQQVLKIKAHQLDLTYHDTLLCYRSLGNHVADVAAGSAAQFLQPSLVRDLSLLDASLTRQRQNLVSLFRMMIEQHACRARLEANARREQALARGCADQEALGPLYRLQHWTCPVPWVSTAPQRDMTEHCAFGASIARNVIGWLETLLWPLQPQETDWGISYVELAASWMMYSGMVVPVKRKDASGKEHLVCCQDFVAAAAYNISFQEIGSNFATLLNQIQSLTDHPRFPPDRCQVKSLYMLGSTFFSQGIRGRPCFPGQDVLVPLLATYVRANPKSYKPLPPLTLPSNLPSCLSAVTVRDEVSAGWAYLANKAHRHSRTMIKWRKEAL